MGKNKLILTYQDDLSEVFGDFFVVVGGRGQEKGKI